LRRKTELLGEGINKCHSEFYQSEFIPCSRHRAELRGEGETGAGGTPLRGSGLMRKEGEHNVGDMEDETFKKLLRKVEAIREL